MESLLSNKELVSHMVWDARRLYRYDEKSKSFIRVYDEPWTADRHWEIQVCCSALLFVQTETEVRTNVLFRQSGLPQNGKPLCLMFYADKNKLSSFGTQKGHPVMMRCLNLEIEIRNGEGIGGGIIVGWLPIVNHQ